MPQVHLLRVGALATVGRFASADAVRYPRGARVIARTSRGLETADVRSHAEWDGVTPLEGTILRGMTVEDDLLVARQARRRKAALTACSRRLDQLGLGVTLVDVEHLFDGRSLVFYFLGEPKVPVDALTAELAEVYEAKVQFRRFAEAVRAGCGPGCGTDAAAGCGTGGGCSAACALTGACASRRA
jgi:cell fate regulator YaaT (PSP1 superfamily)